MIDDPENLISEMAAKITIANLSAVAGGSHRQAEPAFSELVANLTKPNLADPSKPLRGRPAAPVDSILAELDCLFGPRPSSRRMRLERYHAAVGFEAMGGRIVDGQAELDEASRWVWPSGGRPKINVLAEIGKLAVIDAEQTRAIAEQIGRRVTAGRTTIRQAVFSLRRARLGRYFGRTTGQSLSKMLTTTVNRFLETQQLRWPEVKAAVWRVYRAVQTREKQETKNHE